MTGSIGSASHVNALTSLVIEANARDCGGFATGLWCKQAWIVSPLFLLLSVAACIGLPWQKERTLILLWALSEMAWDHGSYWTTGIDATIQFSSSSGSLGARWGHWRLVLLLLRYRACCG